jgi:digeranylgeranylglycerophospholipid reductase
MFAVNSDCNLMDKYDIIIVGAGGAGLMAGRELGKLKYKTLIIDRKDNLLEFSFNTLGSFININDFGLSENVIAQPMNKIILYSKHFKRIIKGQAAVLDKKKLHEELLSSIDSDYVSVLTNTAIKSFAKSETGSISSVTDQNGKTYTADYFIDATGLSGFFTKQLGLQEKKPLLATGVEYNVKYKGNTDEAALLIGKTYQGGYAWIFPLKNERAIIGFGTFDDVVVKELKKRLDKIIELPHIARLVEKDNEKVEGGSIPLTKVLDKFVHTNLICIGDSVSQVNPIAGEGYKFIFEAAIFAVNAIDKAIKLKDASCLLEYEQHWKNRFYANYQFAKVVQEKIFKFSKNDLLVDLAMLYLNLKSNDKVLKVLAGEYSRA